MHCWTCKMLEQDRIKLDEELSKVDPKHLPNAIKIGVAPAMTIDPTKPFWGDCDQHDPKTDDMPESTKKMVGCRTLAKMKYEIRPFFSEERDNNITARELMQQLTRTKVCHDVPLPEKISEGACLPEDPNVYSDGSVKNPRGLHWKVGGVGVWWRNRCIERNPLTQAERYSMFTKHVRKTSASGRASMIPRTVRRDASWGPPSWA